MKVRPILMNTAMVQATLSGRKTQTRRIVKPQPPFGCEYFINGAKSHAVCFAENNKHICVPPTPNSSDHRLLCPYGKIGDLLWVRENWASDEQVDSVKPSDLSKGEPIYYTANSKWRINGCHPIQKGKTRPNIFLMQWMSRLTLEITDVRVERLSDITDKCAIEEWVIEFKVHQCNVDDFIDKCN